MSEHEAPNSPAVRTAEPGRSRQEKIEQAARDHMDEQYLDAIPGRGATARRPRWEGEVEVCNTCDRKAQWPFCEHKTDDGKWYRLVVVREVPGDVVAPARVATPDDPAHADG